MRKWLLLIPMVLAFWHSVSAATVDAHMEDGTSGKLMVIHLDGRIMYHDDEQFTQLLGAQQDGLVILDSIGGNLYSALEIGKLIRARGFTTVARGDCESACALIWLAGVERYVGPDARVGFHAASVIEENGEQTIAGSGNALVGAYLTNLGLPIAAVVYVTSAKPDDITWLTEESKSFGITFKNVPRPTPTPQQAIAPMPAQPATPNQLAVGPSFDCTKVMTQVAQFICGDRDLSRIDLEMVQPYYVLRHERGPLGWKPLLALAVQQMNSTNATCGIDATGNIPANQIALKSCLIGAYLQERSYWLVMLGGAGREEAVRSIQQHITLQDKLQRLGFIPASDRIDGIYGTGTRTAIANWQQSAGLVASGVLGDSDAAKLMATSIQPTTTPVAAMETPSPATLSMTIARLRKAYTNGIVGVIADIQTCYAAAVGPAATRDCMLYDVAGFYLDTAVAKALGNPGLVQPYFATATTGTRLNQYAVTAFGGWNDRAKTYLLKSALDIATQTVSQ